MNSIKQRYIDLDCFISRKIPKTKRRRTKRRRTKWQRDRVSPLWSDAEWAEWARAQSPLPKEQKTTTWMLPPAPGLCVFCAMIIVTNIILLVAF
jgi:hypothetical protein